MILCLPSQHMFCATKVLVKSERTLKSPAELHPPIVETISGCLLLT